MTTNDIDNYFNFFWNEKWTKESCKEIFGDFAEDIWKDYKYYILLVGVYAASALLWYKLSDNHKTQLINYINENI